MKLLLIFLALATLVLVVYVINNLLKARVAYWTKFLDVSKSLVRSPSSKSRHTSRHSHSSRSSNRNKKPPFFIGWWFTNNWRKLCGALASYALILSMAYLIYPLLQARSKPSRLAADLAVPDELKDVRRRYIELSAALEKNTNDPALLLSLARIQRDMGTLPQAKNSYRKLLTLQPNSRDGLFELGRLATMTNEPDLAATMADRLDRLWPARPEAELLRAQAAVLAKNQDAARSHWRAALQRDPANREASTKLVASYMDQHNYKEAERIAAGCLASQADNTDLRLLMAGSMDGQQRTAEAVQLLQKAAGEGRSIPVLLLLAEFQMKLKDYVSAIAVYDEILKRDPHHKVALNNLAQLLADHGFDLDRAAQLASQLYSHSPGNPQVADTLGWILVRQGKVGQALPLLRQAVAGAPGNPAHRYHYGAALIKQGQPEEGRKELKAALKISKDFDGADDARALAGN